MAINRKLGRTTDIRNAMLKTGLTDLIWHGKIETTEARAKELKSLADSIISLAIKEKDNFETVDAKVVKAKLDSITVAGTFETIWESDTEIKYSYLSTKFSAKLLTVSIWHTLFTKINKKTKSSNNL